MKGNDLDRRTFLLFGSALPFLSGCDDGPSAEASTASSGPAQGNRAADPTWLTAALRRMKETGRWGVVLVAPEGKPERIRLGRSLYDLAEFDDDAAVGRELLSQVVLVTMTSEHAASRFPTPGIKPTRILLSPEGGTLAADGVALEVYKDPTTFAASYKDFIYGPDRARLKAHAEKMAATFDDARRQSLAKLDSEDADIRIEGAVELSKYVDAIAPYLGFVAEFASRPETRREARLLLRRYHGSLQAETPGARLPYGSTLGKFVDSCGYYVPADQEMMIACGMARVIRRSGKFISFLGR